MTLTTLTHPTRAFKTFTISFLFIALQHSLAGFAAPAPPDAGQTLRELQKLPDLNLPQSGPQLQIDQELHIDESIPDNTKDNKTVDARFMVKTIQVSGNKEISTGELEALVADLKGAEHDLKELSAGAARITAHYRSRGYPVARAYLPAQDIIDGAVSINVIEGQIAKHRIDNNSRLSDNRANGFLDRIKDGDVIRTAPIDRALLLLHDTPGVGGARATLKPGAGVGTSDLLVELKPGAAYSGNISLDNYGDRYFGANRLGGTINLNSPFKIGDQINFGVVATDQHLAYGRLAYQLPIGGDGLRVGAAYSTTRYRLGKEFSVLAAHGKAASSSAFAIYPFIRNLSSNLKGTFTLEQKAFTDYVDVTSTVTKMRVRFAILGFSGNLGSCECGSFSSFDLSLSLGRLEIDSPTALAIDNATARTNGAFSRLAYTANSQQRLTDSNWLFFSLTGQQASMNLDSYAKFSLGGSNGVRAYPQGEGVGDQGYLANLELRHNFSDNLQGTLFYDTGLVTINRNPFDLTVPNGLRLSGAGVGANADLAGTKIKISLARRTDGGLPVTIPASAIRSTTVWLQASEQF